MSGDSNKLSVCENFLQIMDICKNKNYISEPCVFNKILIICRDYFGIKNEENITDKMLRVINFCKHFYKSCDYRDLPLLSSKEIKNMPHYKLKIIASTRLELKNSLHSHGMELTEEKIKNILSGRAILALYGESIDHKNHEKISIIANKLASEYLMDLSKKHKVKSKQSKHMPLNTYQDRRRKIPMMIHSMIF